LQKELTINEGFLLLDMLVAPAVSGVGSNEAPANPTPGECHIVGDAPTGSWAGHSRSLAGYGDGGWRFVAPVTGMSVVVDGSLQTAVFDGQIWQVGKVAAASLSIEGQQVVGPRQPAIASPIGGTAPDVEARASINAILAALRTHGLITA
jgi:hypothetical protein